MQTFSANKAKTQFGQCIDLAQRKPVGEMVSAQGHEAMRKFYANRPQHNLVLTVGRAECAGMTPELREDLPTCFDRLGHLRIAQHRPSAGELRPLGGKKCFHISHIRVLREQALRDG
jgi:hypothetical protein